MRDLGRPSTDDGYQQASTYSFGPVGTTAPEQKTYDLFTLLVIAGFAYFAGVLTILMAMPRAGG